MEGGPPAIAIAQALDPHTKSTRYPSTTKEPGMGEKTDQVKGRVKEAVGDLTDDDDLKRDGKTDRVAGQVKEHVGDAKDKVEEVIDKTKDAVRR